ncbi:MAG: N-6 DNA methylase [Lachnospiraceae bacterium]|nr:N-6 DNA methylase [Lachnospiraceae bacterium]
MELGKLEQAFKNNVFYTEDDVKLCFYSDIIKPLLEELNPTMVGQYKSEDMLLAGGRTDATFQNIVFELKKINYFETTNGIHEALYGRNEKDHGLYDYIISNAEISKNDSAEDIAFKLLNRIGVGFDGNSFLFARFISCKTAKPLNTAKLKLSIDFPIPIAFNYEKREFSSGLKKLALLLKQQDKIALNKRNLISIINPKSPFVRNSIKTIYDELDYNLNDLNGSTRVRTLYNEWNRVFGAMYGEDKEATSFTEVSSVIKEIYGYSDMAVIDSKIYLFALQTFFNIFLKLLVYSFLAQLVSPTFKAEALTKHQIDKLFDGELNKYESLVSNFFESHFMEWFTYTYANSKVDTVVVNNILEVVNQFDLSTYILKPEEIQDILQEVYMELIPSEMRHLMGEYFSPDWIVEHALDMVGYEGDMNKTLMDPTAGSGTFLTHAIKRVVQKNAKKLLREDVEKITHNIIGFDINPISVVAAKANYILAVFSSCDDSVLDNFTDPIEIPIYIADSILSPVVYAEESEFTLSIDTFIGKFQIPKFSDYKVASEFLKILSKHIDDKCDFDIFWNKVENRLIDEKYELVVRALFDQLYALHRAGQDSFWPIILRNSFAPILISDKFDFIIGNPPWISWKSMSKRYREGTEEIWKSYGIFEKNAYDKKTTHDDFGMAVTYVAVDKYLKNNGNMVFLLPASFLKSTKGGEGFRKFSITRYGQNVPFSVDAVDDFSKVKLFTIATIAVKIIKGIEMKYPMDSYKVWEQIGRRSSIDSHAKWNDVVKKLRFEMISAQPVDKNDKQSAWLTLPDMAFANRLLDPTKTRYYSGRKGIEPAGAKGVYLLKKPIKTLDGFMLIENCIERQRRKDILKKGVHKEKVEETYIFPMLGGRNIAKWQVKSNEYMLIPHTSEYKYGIPVKELSKIAPKTSDWLNYYHDELLASRVQNGKFFNKNTQPYYRLDNVGEYTYAPYKVLWKEQTGSMSAVVVGSYLESIPNADENLFREDKTIVVDSKVLMLGLDNPSEAYYVCGIMNAEDVVKVIDGYAISTNRGVDVLKYLAIPKFEKDNKLHQDIASLSKKIHLQFKANEIEEIDKLERELNALVRNLFV